MIAASPTPDTEFTCARAASQWPSRAPWGMLVQPCLVGHLEGWQGNRYVLGVRTRS